MKPETVEELRQQADQKANRIREKSEIDDPNALAHKIEEARVSDLLQKKNIEDLKKDYPEAEDEIDSLHLGLETLKDECENQKTDPNTEDKDLTVDDFQAWDFEADENSSGSWDYIKLADTIEYFETFKYISEDDTDQLFIKEEGIWKEKGESKVTNYCMELTNEEMYSKRAINNVKDIIKNRNRIYKEEKFFQPPERKVPFNNGVYDVEKDEFRPYQDEDNFLFKHPVNYVENLEEEDEEKVEEFLDTVQDTKRKKQILKECAGLALLPSYPIDKAPILFGDGGNGKGVFVDMLEKMLADYHEINLGEFTDDDFAKAELENTTFVFFDEFQHIGDVSKVKQFIGSEEFRVRHMHQEGYMAKQIAFPILAGNELPNPPERRPSFWRRWEIIDFPYRFTEKNDEHKDMKSKSELEQKYWTQEALDCYATKAVHTLKDTIERQGFTDGQTIKEVEHRWNQRATPVYSFLTHFVEQGDLPRQGTTDSADTIVKEILLEMVNNYMEEVNGGNVQMYELSQAIERSPDLERGNDQQMNVGNATTTAAYSGIKLTLPSFDDLDQTNNLQSSVIRKLVVEYWEHFSDVESKQGAQIVEIVKTELYGKVLNYLDLCKGDQASLLEIIKALDLEEDEIPKVMECDYIRTVESGGSEIHYPVLEFDREAFKDAVEEHGSMIVESGDLKPVSRWVGEKIRDLTNNQRVNIDDYFVDPGKEKGYSEERIEDEIESRMDKGEIFDPEPGKIEVLT